MPRSLHLKNMYDIFSANRVVRMVSRLLGFETVPVFESKRTKYTRTCS